MPLGARIIMMKYKICRCGWAGISDRAVRSGKEAGLVTVGGFILQAGVELVPAKVT